MEEERYEDKPMPSPTDPTVRIYHERSRLLHVRGCWGVNRLLLALPRYWRHTRQTSDMLEEEFALTYLCSPIERRVHPGGSL